MPNFLPQVFQYQSHNNTWLYFKNTIEIISTQIPSEVIPCLNKIENFAFQGFHVAGFLSYETAGVFEPRIPVFQSDGTPLIWFGVFRETETIKQSPPIDFLLPDLQWVPSISEETYNNHIEKIRHYIKQGETYQVNYTFALQTEIPRSLNLFDLFRYVTFFHPTPYSMFLETESQIICSFSPELFFYLQGDSIECRPMKGTAHRGKTTSEDQTQANELYNSEKNRSENIMIVDMIRNDLGKIAKIGTVSAPKLFEIERYNSLFQMTSTVRAKTSSSLNTIFSALFPCASITGAPKIRTTAIIHELENRPRGIYCGAMGSIRPGREALFNVAIRTLVIDKKNRNATYNIGSGIIWDSEARDEFQECLLKSHFLSEQIAPFDLLESLLYCPKTGYYLLDEHLTRYQDSANYFGFTTSYEEVKAYLQGIFSEMPSSPVKIRCVISRQRHISHTISPIRIEHQQLTFPFAKESVDPNNRFLYHKTTHRLIYQKALASQPGYTDVLLWNKNGEITETTCGNIVAQIQGKFLTPPVSCGLLPGTLRAHLLESGKISESPILISDLSKCDHIWRINSVRGWQRINVDAHN